MPSPLSPRDIRDIRRQISPTFRDTVVAWIEVWRMPTSDSGTIPDGGSGLNAGGFEVEGNPDPARGDQLIVKVHDYAARIIGARGGRDEVAGSQPVSVVPWTILFNGNDDPDIQGGDRLLVAVIERVAGTWQRVVWQASHAYLDGDIVQPTDSNGHSYSAAITGGGVSGSTEPTWANGVVDGEVTWTDLGDLRTFELLDPSGNSTLQINQLVGVQEVT